VPVAPARCWPCCVPATRRLWYIDRIAEALEHYTADTPIVVVIDDAQWTDEFSVLALRVLVHTLVLLSCAVAAGPAPGTGPVGRAGGHRLAGEQGAGQLTLDR